MICKIIRLGNGYVRSEAIVTVFLQRSSEARRSYATVVEALTNNDGFKDQGITFPNGAMQNKLIQEVYNKCGVDPIEVSYVEAHGTGTKVLLLMFMHSYPVSCTILNLTNNVWI